MIKVCKAFVLGKKGCALYDNQVEFEGIKLELTQKNEEQEELRGQLDEAARLREIAEKQLDEALEALKDEREQKNSLRRELSALTLNPFESVGNLELHLDQLDDSQEEGREGEREGGAEDQDSGINNGPGSAPSSAPPPHLGGSKYNGLIHRYSTPRNSDVFLRAPASGLVSDLLSELQFSDSQKLKQQLLQVKIFNPVATNFSFDGRDCCFERGGHFSKCKLVRHHHRGIYYSWDTNGGGGGLGCPAAPHQMLGQ